MAVFRINKTRDYTVMSNHHLRNTALPHITYPLADQHQTNCKKGFTNGLKQV